MENKTNILIVKNRALGDSIMGLSSVQYLRKLYPKANIIYAVPQWVAPLYINTVTEANEIYPLRLNSLKDIYQFSRDLKKLKIDHIHEMQQSGRGAKIFKILSIVMRIPYTFHNHHLTHSTRVIDQGKTKPILQRDLDGVYSYLGSGEIPNFLDFTPKLETKIKSNKKKRIIFGVVATRKTKMWPLNYYVELARLIKTEFPQFEIGIALSKSEADLQIKKELEDLNPPTNVKIEHVPLPDLPAYFAESSFYIGNDTGQKHLAIAMGLKSFTFFGAEPVLEWHPYDYKKHPYFFIEELECRTRTRHYCGLDVCDLQVGNMQCLKLLTPEKIFQEIKTTCMDFHHSSDQ
jgi:heptosyltransferase-2